MQLAHAGIALNRHLLSANRSIFAIINKKYKMHTLLDIQFELKL